LVNRDALPALISQLIRETRALHPDRPALIGMGGAQGSGKSYQCRAYAAAHADVAHFSLDDVYLTRAEREALAAEIHPLCATRGPPGTHDLDLADATIASLENPSRTQRTPLPRFDKRTDDRAPKVAWPVFEGLPHAILVDGWCMGAAPLGDDLTAPLNALERDEDVSGLWRAFGAAFLADAYQTFFDGFDALIYLQAPSWKIVRIWRGQQEEETLGRPLNAEENAALDRFVMHYERVTRAMLAGHHSAGWIVHLDEARNVARIEER
jgi:D-glycerate 3-kinase